MILLKAYRDINGEILKVVEGSFQDLDAISGGLIRVPAADMNISSDELINLDLDAKLDDNQLIDDDTFASATSNNIPSAESVKAYVDSQVSSIDEAVEIIFNPATSTLTDVNVQSAIDSLDAKVEINTTEIVSNDIDIAELQLNQNDIISLTGVSENDADLGTFTGDIISDNVDIKSALQELEVEIDLLNSEESTLALNTATNMLTHTSNQGTITNLDLSLYLDDTNLARLVNGTLDSVTGIATFERDDATTFTLDLSSLLDNQLASEVPVTPVGNLTSTDTQAALEELQSDIDALNSVVKEYVYANQTVAQTGIENTAISVRFDNTALNSNATVFDVNNTNGEITVNKTSNFKIEYIITADTSDGARRTSETTLEIDTGAGFVPLSSALGSSTAYGYHRNNASGENSASGQALLSLTSGDKLRLVIRRSNGLGTIETVANGTSISIEEK